MTRTVETWLDIMPAIPLARGVPVLNKMLHPAGGKDIVCGPGEGSDWYLTVGSSVNTRGQTHVGNLRVDLDDPQGFGYALRYALSHGVGFCFERDYNDAAVLERWVNGNTTNADRLTLAKALREVSR